MDQIDQGILRELSANGRATVSEISKQVRLSVPAVAERIRKLEESGVIGSYTVQIDRKKSGFGLMAFISVRIESTERIGAFREAVLQFPAVLECHHIAGPYDYLLKVLVEDTEALERFLSDSLKQIPGVAGSNTTVVLSTLKERINPY